ncbi:MAG: metal-sulfur cluster assembly factor, partial [Acidimicrobiales bacterium]|nr:metal-sulfur cluster assembly factor [Acidimicrobiales bacterium]
MEDADCPTPGELRLLLRGVIDPELGSDIVELGMVRDATIDDAGAVTVTIALTTSGCPLRAQIQRDIRSRVGSAPGVTSVSIEWTEM